MMHLVYMQGFDTRRLQMTESVGKIAEGLLELAGITEILDLPDGRRIFTVERKPSDVPIAGIVWIEVQRNEVYAVWEG